MERPFHFHRNFAFCRLESDSGARERHGNSILIPKLSARPPCSGDLAGVAGGLGDFHTVAATSAVLMGGNAGAGAAVAEVGAVVVEAAAVA